MKLEFFCVLILRLLNKRHCKYIGMHFMNRQTVKQLTALSSPLYLLQSWKCFTCTAKTNPS